ncbi:MAG: hypothetical protein HFI34_06270 [Lachnospiraceae bacterium]|nr:hypothetical protein [Lachnospiraceae bacterium]
MTAEGGLEVLSVLPEITSYCLTRCQAKSTVRHGRRIVDGSVQLRTPNAEHLELPPLVVEHSVRPSRA